jgi:hypothetical protein
MVSDLITNAAHERVLGHQKRIVNRLRDMADEIERASFGSTYVHPHSSLASSIVNILSWGFANLNLSILIEAAADAEFKERDDGAPA